MYCDPRALLVRDPLSLHRRPASKVAVYRCDTGARGLANAYASPLSIGIQYGATRNCYTATYDPAGNPLTMTDPYGGTDSYVYDALNRLTKVTRQVEGVTEHVESYSYDAVGALATIFDPVAGAELTLDCKRPMLSGGGTADAVIPNAFGGHPVTLDGGGRITALSGATLVYRFDSSIGPGSPCPVSGSRSSLHSRRRPWENRRR